MEMVLLVVSLVSLALATAMSVLAWKLTRDSRLRSAARVEALESLAFGDDGDLVPALATPAPIATAAPARAFRAGRAAAPPTSARRDDPADYLRRLPFEDRRPAEAQAEAYAGDLFDDAEEHRAPSHRWAAVAAVVAIVAAGAGTFFLVNTPIGLFHAAASVAPRPLELVSLRYAGDEPGYFTVSGLVQNPIGGPQLRGVVAVVYLFDAQGQYVGNGRVALDVATLDPGLESSFILRMPVTAAVSRYRVGFRFPDGTVVAHVDKRVDSTAGQVPAPRLETHDSEGS